MWLPLFIIALVFGVSAAHAQSFNLDAGTELGLPDDSYGGAAESPGVWQVLDFNVEQTVTLVGLDGLPTGVTISSPLPFGPAFTLHDGPSGDDEKLLEDYLDLHSTPVTLEVVGLAAGRYRVFTYAWAPDDERYVTLVSINDDNWALGGPWPGHLEPFVTHALHEVDIAEGAPLAISVFGVDKGTLNGLQIVRVPDDPPPVGDPQGFNLDAGARFGEPDASWGAAAGQPGRWMPLAFSAENPVTLQGLEGQPTTIRVTANLPFGPASFAHDGPSGDDEKLLEDYLDLHSTPGTFDFSGVPAGDYVVYTYAWGPDDDRYRTQVTIGDVTQQVGGPWPGGLAEGVTHARHKVTVPPSGKLTIKTFGTKGTLNGIQLVPAEDDRPVEAPPEVVEAEPEVVEPEPEAEVIEPEPEVVEAEPEVVEPEVVEVEPEVVAPEQVEPAEVEPEVIDVADEATVEPRRGHEDGCGAGGAQAGLALAMVLTTIVTRARRRPRP